MTATHPFTPAEASRNERISQFELFFAAPFIIITASYVPVLAARLDASPLLLGAITSGSAAVLAIASALGRWWAARKLSDKARLLVPMIIHRTQLLWIPLLLLLPALRAEAIAAMVMVLSLFGGLANVTFAMLMPRMTNRDRLSYLVSSRWTMLGVAMAIFTPALAWVLDRLPIPLNYAVVCGIAGLFTALNTGLLTRVRLAPRSAVEPNNDAPRLSSREVLLYRPALSYILVTFAMHFAINAAAPLVTLRLVRDLQATDSDFGWYTAAVWAAIAVVGLIAPRIVRALGMGRLFAISGAVFAFQALLMALSGSIPVTWVAGAINGIATVLFQVTAFGLLTETAPPGNYENYVPLHTTVVNLAIFSAPLVMTGLVSLGLSIQLGLLVCVVFRAAAGLWAYARHGRI